MATYYSFNLEYSSKAKQVLEFLQEKLIHDQLPANRKVTRSYELYRAIDCLEHKVGVVCEDKDEDATQLECDIE